MQSLLQKVTVTLLGLWLSAGGLNAQSAPSQHPCKRQFHEAFDKVFWEIGGPLRHDPEAAILLLMDYDESGTITTVDYVVKGQQPAVIKKMAARLQSLIENQQCFELAGPGRVYWPIAMLPYPYFEVKQDPSLRTRETLFRLDPELMALLEQYYADPNWEGWPVLRYQIHVPKYRTGCLDATGPAKY